MEIPAKLNLEFKDYATLRIQVTKAVAEAPEKLLVKKDLITN